MTSMCHLKPNPITNRVVGDRTGLSMSTDGVSPYKRAQMSFWPVAFTCLNLPPWARLKIPTSHISMVVPGHYGDMAPYMEIAMDELAYTYYFGCTENEKIKAMLLQYQADHKAVVSIQNLADVGSRIGACSKCNIKGQPGPGLQPAANNQNKGVTSHGKRTADRAVQKSVKKARKQGVTSVARTTERTSRKGTIYPNWRSCHTHPDKARASKLNPTFNSHAERHQVNLLEQHEMKSDAQLRQWAMDADSSLHVVGSHKHAEHPSRRTGVKGSNPLQLLPYFDSTKMCHPDPAHTISNESKAMYKCITGAYTPQQLQTCIKYEQDVNGRWLQPTEPAAKKKANSNGKESMPWLLSKASIDTGIKRGRSMVAAGFIPSSLSSLRFWKLFENPGHLKMQEHIVMCGPLGKYLLQGLLPKEQQEAIFAYLDSLGRLWSRSQRTDQLLSLQQEVRLALVKMETAFPGWELNLNRHNVLHMADACLITGPTPTFTTFFFERLWGRLARWLKQKVQPEATMMFSYRAYQSTCHFMTHKAKPGCKSPLTPDKHLQEEENELERSVDGVLMPQFLHSVGYPTVRLL